MLDNIYTQYNNQFNLIAMNQSEDLISRLPISFINDYISYYLGSEFSLIILLGETLVFLFENYDLS